MTYDPVKMELFKNLYSSVAEEMGVALCRTSFSPNIKERLDAIQAEKANIESEMA